MTVATDLQRQDGPRRRLYCRIDGLPYRFWQDDGTGTNPDTGAVYGSAVYGNAVYNGDNTGIVCLKAPRDEWSHGLDLATMKVTASSMMIELINVRDPSDVTKWLFSTLFAPGRWSQSTVAQSWLTKQLTTDAQLTANATEIWIKGDALGLGFSSSGVAYMGQEAFSYTGITNGLTDYKAKTASKFTGVVKGIYPCVETAANWGHTYSLSGDCEAKQIAIATVPYTILGRRISLYVITWDDSTGTWHPTGNAQLLWVGRITDRIRYSSSEDTWQLGCESILADLDKQLATDLPQSPLQFVNLSGTKGRTFTVGVLNIATAGWTNHVVSVPAGIYAKGSGLLKAVISAWGSPAYGYATGNWVDGKCRITISIAATYTSGAWVRIRPWKDVPTASSPDYTPCHALMALGFPAEQFVANSDGLMVHYVAATEPAEAYHPLHYDVNGGKLVVELTTDFWATQGDYDPNTASAFAGIDKAIVDAENTTARYVAKYTAKGTVSCTDYSAFDANYLTLAAPSSGVGINDGYSTGRAMRKVGDEPVQVEQIWMPHAANINGVLRGPFELLLYPLLSTGTQTYNANSSYDMLPTAISVGIQEALIDVDSFRNADKLLPFSDLIWRRQYVIDKAISFSDLAAREGKLLGYTIVWRRGKLMLVDVFGTDWQAWTETINESVRARVDEWIDADASKDIVINAWEIKCNYSTLTGKPDIVEINDVDSQVALGEVKLVTIDHPGLRLQDPKAFLTKSFGDRSDMLRYPWQVVDVTLAPTMVQRVYVGDVIKYISSRHPDPYGTGSMSTTCFGITIDESTSLETWTKKATLLLNVRYNAAAKRPWAAGALVDMSATNGGWDAATHELTLVAHQYGNSATDSHDGAAFAYSASDPDKVLIIEASPTQNTMPQMWGPFATSAAYNTSTRKLALAGSPTLSGWSSTKRYKVMPARYADSGTGQKTLNAWQADSNGKLGGTDAPHRWAA